MTSSFLAEHRDTVGLQMGHGGCDVVDTKRQWVVAAPAMIHRLVGCLAAEGIPTSQAGVVEAYIRAARVARRSAVQARPGRRSAPRRRRSHHRDGAVFERLHLTDDTVDGQVLQAADELAPIMVPDRRRQHDAVAPVAERPQLLRRPASRVCAAQTAQSAAAAPASPGPKRSTSTTSNISVATGLSRRAGSA